MATRKQLRRLRHLCSICHPPYKYQAFDMQAKKQELTELTSQFKGTPMDERLEMILLFEKLGYSQEEALVFWKESYFDYKLRSSIYGLKPVRERKDNKTTLNVGSGGTNRSWIRYPKKVRKTAWKRFYKLFPHLKKSRD